MTRLMTRARSSPGDQLTVTDMAKPPLGHRAETVASGPGATVLGAGVSGVRRERLLVVARPAVAPQQGAQRRVRRHAGVRLRQLHQAQGRRQLLVGELV